MNYRPATYWVAVLATAFITSCSTPGPASLFAKKSLHDQYGDRLTEAGLKETAIGRQWFDAADKSVSQPLSITLPYSETGYFSAERPSAVGVRFSAKRGQKVTINLTKKPTVGFAIYLDVWQPGAQPNKPKLVASADTSNASLTQEVKQDGSYIVRLQPELLRGGEYTLTITTGPSLAFPVSPKAKSNMASFWGANRDAGARKHEGIDIMTPFRSPLVAAANGTITAVNENALGGKAVWLRPDNADYTLYYAHLDEQLVTQGEKVSAGTTVGLAGTTGNAKGGPPHLHFGIYTNGGAIDPFPFINPVSKPAEKITAPLTRLGEFVRNEKATKVYGEPVVTPSNNISIEANTLLRVEAGTANWYKVSLPDGYVGYVNSSAVVPVNDAVKKYTASSLQPLLDAPLASAAKKATIKAGQSVNVLGTYKDFYFVKADTDEGWISRRPLP